jgi:glycosyltransferase involved in cell wall biosynthesis
MNIAILIPSLDMGGAERVSQLLGNHWIEQGHKVYYILTDVRRKVVHDVKGEIIFLDIPYLALSGTAGFALLLNGIKEVKKVKRKYKIDISISFMEWSNPLNVMSKCGDKVILGVRTALSKRDDFHGFHFDKRFIKFIYAMADAIVAVSEFSRGDMIENYGLNPRKIVTIPNAAIRPSDFCDEKEWLYGDKCVICLSRFNAVKQLDRIIRAFSVVVKREPKARLVILGEGGLKDYLVMICNRYNLSKHVIFEGYTYSPGYYLKHARAFVMASKAEGFPNAMAEAMACGVPVITTDSPGGCGEIVGKNQSSSEIQYCEYGILTPYIKGKAPRSLELEPEEVLLGEAMMEVLENDEVYQHYHEASLSRAEYYSKERVMKMWDGIVSRG